MTVRQLAEQEDIYMMWKEFGMSHAEAFHTIACDRNRL